MTERQFLLGVIAEKGAKLAYNANRILQRDENEVIQTENGRIASNNLLFNTMSEIVAVLEILGEVGNKYFQTDNPQADEIVDAVKRDILSQMEDARSSKIITGP